VFFRSELYTVAAYLGCRYLLPSLVALSLVWAKRQASRGPSHRTVTEASLQNTISELSLIQELIPSLQSQPFSWSSPPLHVLTRVTASIYIPYLIITYGVPLRILLAISGTFALSWRAPWLVIIRRTLWRSAYVRWSYYSLWARVSGEPMADVRISNQPTLSTPEPVNSLRFLFEIYENQRWWMGLDFTAALLPSERPSWSSKNQQPVSPPNSFNLPEPSIVYLPDSKGGRIKRTATWRWEEPEWTVVIHTKGGVASRVERPLPAIKDDQSMLNKAAAKMRESAGPMSPKITDENKLEDHNSSTQDNGDDSFTDPDGWVFADNSWEHRGARGGMGKVSGSFFYSMLSELITHYSTRAIDDGQELQWPLRLLRSSMTAILGCSADEHPRQTNARQAGAHPLQALSRKVVH